MGNKIECSCCFRDKPTSKESASEAPVNLARPLKLQRKEAEPCKSIPLEELSDPDAVTVRSEHAPLYAPLLTTLALRTRKTLPLFQYDFTVPGVERKPAGVLLSDDSVYIGQWKDGKRYGQGTCYLSDGGLMEGYWSNGLHFKGRTIYANGDLYEGGYSHGFRHGKGRFQNYAGSYSYLGDWQHDHKYGFGVERTPDGATYEGGFVDDMKQGKGKFRQVTGELYEGEFFQGQMHGKGKFTWVPEKRYSEDWLEGTGTVIEEQKVYEGDFVMGKKHGTGLLRWMGNCYEGEFVDNQMHGVGWLQEKGKSKQKWQFMHNKKVALVEEINDSN